VGFVVGDEFSVVFVHFWGLGVYVAGLFLYAAIMMNNPLKSPILHYHSQSPASKLPFRPLFPFSEDQITAKPLNVDRDYEDLSESEAVIRAIIARRRVPSLSEFKRGIQQYKAGEMARKADSDRAKRTIKKRALAKLNRSKLTINLNLDTHFPQEDATARSSQRGHSHRSPLLRPLRKITAPRH
jgi:hypothetical protein